MASPTIAAWSNFLIAQAGAAAALTGLVFVAVSINLPRILELPGVTMRAAQSISQLFGALTIATLLLIPDQSTEAIGWELLSVGGLLWVIQSLLQVQQIRIGFKVGWPLWWTVWRLAFSQFATLPFCIAGGGLLTGAADALYWMAPGYICSLALGMASAWVLLIEIMR